MTNKQTSFAKEIQKIRKEKPQQRFSIWSLQEEIFKNQEKTQKVSKSFKNSIRVDYKNYKNFI